MIAANIGRKFLNAYNEKYNSKFSAKDFFIEIYWEIFYNHKKYMQWITNSPFVQGITTSDTGEYAIEIKKVKLNDNDKIECAFNEAYSCYGKDRITKKTDNKKKTIVILLKNDTVLRLKKLNEFTEKILANEADASIAIGFPSLDITATTSGQITNMHLPLKEEDVYLSWIGSGFGIGVRSGLSIFFDNKQILLDIYDGWQLYRNYLNQTPKLRGNQINTWNGQWIAHRYNEQKYDPNNPTASYNPFDTKKDGTMELNTQSWVNILVGISRNYSNTIETSYVYNLGQTNITVGFIPFELPQIKYPFDLYAKYFNKTKNDIVENLFGSAIGFSKACQMGAIGVNAMEPKGFRDCLEKGSLPKYNPKDEEKTINFNTYQIWLLAMLNNEQLWEEAQKIATTLNSYSKSDKNAKTKKSQEVSNLLISVNKKQFIENLVPLVKEGTDVSLLSEIGKMINAMPIDNVPYFLTLIRFQYAVINNIKS